MPNPSNNQKNDMATFNILSNGKEINSLFKVLSVKVDKTVNAISSCEITLNDGRPGGEDFPVSDSDSFVPGSKIEIKMGYDNVNKTVFKGIVTSQQLRISAAEGPLLEVLCHDESVKMRVGRKNRSFKNTTDSEVWSSIINEYGGLSAQVTATTLQLPVMTQYYVTDWDFLLSRAEFNGMIVTTNEGQVSVSDPNDLTEEVLEVRYGSSILSFDARLNSLDQYSEIHAQAWDPPNQTLRTSDAESQDSGQGNISGQTLAGVVGLDKYLLETSAPLSDQSLNTWAKGEATKGRYTKIMGNVSFQGNAQAVAGKLIELQGVGERFSGKALMSSVRHVLSQGNWLTEVQFGLSPDNRTSNVPVEAPLAAGVLPGIQGLQNGTVKQIDQDPEGQFRVLVDIPIMATEGMGIWARLSTFNASNGSGAFFYPEVGDEVILGFVNNDPRAAVILGSVYSNKLKKPPFTPDEENSTKALVTSAGLKMVYDDGNKEITVTTPGGNTMVWSDSDKSVVIKDQNSNAITMSASGIDISSNSSLTLSAQNSISIKAGASVHVNANDSVDVNSTGQISMRSGEISAQAETTLNLSGLSTSLHGVGEVTINGAMVMIN